MNLTTYTDATLALAAARSGPTPDYAPTQILTHRAEGHVATDEARCSWWLDTAPPLAGERPGILGHFAATSPAAARAVLDQACAELTQRGATLAIGPMDGNTWRRYRWVTATSPDEAPFLMEPGNPSTYPVWWAEAGFAPFATYQSALVTALDTRDPRLDRVRERLARDGITIRTLADLTDPARFERELRALHSVSLVSFAHNFLYTPLSEEDFVAQYLPYREKILPEFVFIAEHAGRCIGYMFSLPDYLRPSRGLPLDTLILKTAAILPARAYAGLGALLAEMTHHAARAAGFARVIHALALDDNPVTNITARHGSVMRRYSLLSRGLAPSSV
jgi:hypothetical protein